METIASKDPRAHTANVQKEFRELIEHLRGDINKIDEPKAQALFETADRLPSRHGESSAERPSIILRRLGRNLSKIFSEGAGVRAARALDPRNPMSEVSDQLPAAALARARSLQAARKAFISARSRTIRLATPLYFFVIPMTVRLTAPWWTRP